MYSSPIHAVPKPGMDTFPLINDQSAGEFSPNSMIHPDSVAGTYTCGSGPLLCMAEILIPFDNEIITGKRTGGSRPLLCMAQAPV